MGAVHISDAGLLDLGDQTPRGIAGHAHAILRASDLSRDEVDQMPIGEVHRKVLGARASIVGDVLDCTILCPECATTLSFEVAVADLCVFESTPDARVELVDDGVLVVAHPPSTLDLRAAVTDPGADSEAGVRAALIRRCVVATDDTGNAVPADRLADDVIAEIARLLDDLDPLIDPRFGLSCYSCGHTFIAEIDIGAFVFGELAARGRQLVYEIDALAVRYGWTEAEILALPQARRARYLELIG